MYRTPSVTDTKKPVLSWCPPQRTERSGKTSRPPREETSSCRHHTEMFLVFLVFAETLMAVLSYTQESPTQTVLYTVKNNCNFNCKML